MRYLFSVLILLSMMTIDETRKGREGNKKFYEQKYEEAETSFLAGLASIDAGEKSKSSSGLYNNLASALHKQKKFEEAAASFQNAVQTANNPKERSRALFNSGNNVVQMQQLDAALDFYKQALLEDQSNESARYNYEFVKRLKNDQQQENSGGNDQDQEKKEQQNQDQKNQEQDENQKQNQENQRKEDAENDPEQQEQQDEPEPDPNQMSKEEAQRILEKLQSDEKELLKQSRRIKGNGKKSKKDW